MWGQEVRSEAFGVGNLASQARVGKDGKKRYRKLRYFYLNDDLHRSLFISQARDEMVAWNYPQKKRVVYTYSDVRRRKEPAFTTQEVCKLLNRQRDTVEKAMLRGEFPTPQHAYKLDENMRKTSYQWSQTDVLNAQAYFLTVHYGRPRNDGLITPYPIPTVRELKALMRQEEILYVRDGDEFKPVWAARN